MFTASSDQIFASAAPPGPLGSCAYSGSSPDTSALVDEEKHRCFWESKTTNSLYACCGHRLLAAAVPQTSAVQHPPLPELRCRHSLVIGSAQAPRHRPHSSSVRGGLVCMSGDHRRRRAPGSGCPGAGTRRQRRSAGLRAPESHAKRWPS